MEDLEKTIESDKLILSTIPKLNKKNIATYVDTLNEMIKKYDSAKSALTEKIQVERDRILNVEVSPKIQELTDQITNYEYIFKKINDQAGSYEKMGLDKSVYRLGKFYKEDLESINKTISACIQRFKDVGINLTIEDFDYSYFGKQYMSVFLEEFHNGDINSDQMKEEFERIFWKCPDIVIHIKVNFMYLFLKYQSKIDKYYETVKEEAMATLKFPLQELNKLYVEKREELDRLISEDKATIINKFYNGQLATSDYSDDKVQSYYEAMINVKEGVDLNSTALNDNIVKFIESLREFKEYSKYKYIIDDIKAKYNDRANHKNEFQTMLKEVQKKEREIFKQNKKMGRKSLFGRNKQEDKKADYLQLFLDLKDDYKKLYYASLYDKINKSLNDNSTLYEILNFSLGFYNYLVETIMLNNAEVEFVKSDKDIEDLKEFIKNPKNTIIKNLTISDTKEVFIMISDRYKLLDFRINKEDINADNADNIISTLSKIELKHIMDDQGIKLEEMQFIVDSKKILPQ